MLKLEMMRSCLKNLKEFIILTYENTLVMCKDLTASQNMKVSIFFLFIRKGWHTRPIWYQSFYLVFISFLAPSLLDIVLLSFIVCNLPNPF